MHAIESDIAGGEFKPGDRLPVRAALAQRYGLTADAIMRAQGELLSVGVLHKGQVYGALYVSRASDRQAPRAPLSAALALLIRADGRRQSRRAGQDPAEAGPRRQRPATREHTHARAS
jgi:DNA-binding GntR family transcriptional regulator